MSVSSYILKKIDDDDVPLHDLKKTISVKFRNINSKRRHILSPQKHFSPHPKKEKRRNASRSTLFFSFCFFRSRKQASKRSRKAHSALLEKGIISIIVMCFFCSLLSSFLPPR